MNQWTTPLNGGTEYCLTDDDNDGVFEGTFFIEDYNNGWLAFKIFNRIADWSNREDFYGCEMPALQLFPDEVLKVAVDSRWDNNIDISNRKGGELKVSFNSEDMTVELSYATQPEKPEQPEVYLIGKFNDWKTPDADSENGAYKLTMSDNTYLFYYNGVLNLPAGDPLLKLYVKGNDSCEDSIWGVNYPSVTLCKMNGTPDTCVIPIIEKESENNISPISISNWSGGELEVEIGIEYSLEAGYIALSGKSQPEFPFGDKVYGIYDTGAGERNIIELPIKEENSYCTRIWAKGPDPSIIFTTENSLNPAPENCWGISEADASDVKEKFYSLVRGGQPISVSFNDTGRLWIETNWANEVFRVVTMELNDYEDWPDQIYLIGSPQGWDINDGSMSLPLMDVTPDGSCRYRGEFEISESDPTFRFYTELGDWDRCSLGSQYEDSPINVPVKQTLISRDVIWTAKGSWRIYDCEPGVLQITVWLKGALGSVDFARLGWIGVEDPEEPVSKETVYYNLQGVRLDGPTSGLVIKVSEGKASKIYVR